MNKTNREAHEEAAGMGLEDAFFRFNKIDPDATALGEVIDPIARCPHCNTTYTWRDEKWYSPVRIQQHCGCPRNWTCAVCNKAVLTPADFAEYEKNGAHVECAREEMYGTKHFPPPLTQAEKEELETEERWGLPPSARCKVCGAVCDIYPDPPEQGTCYEHCEDHYFQVVDREARCYHCNQPAPDDWYDSEDV